MSLLDQRRLIGSIHPFGLLSEVSLDALLKKIDIAYYPSGVTLISKSLESVAFYIIIKGSVQEILDSEVLNVYSSGDSFDADSLIYSKSLSDFIVSEDLICYEIKKDHFLDLLQEPKVSAYFLQDFATRHQQLKQLSMQSEMTPFIVSRVSDIYLHAPCVVGSSTTIHEALMKLEDLRSGAIIVQEGENFGIVSDSDLRRRVLLAGLSTDERIGSIATYGLISVDINDFLFNALLVMTQNEIKRVVVLDDGKIVGLLNQLDLLSYFTSHSHLIALKIDRAKSIEDLQEIEDEFRSLITLLRSKGVKVRYIAKLISSLNEKIYKKLFFLCVDEELRSKCALIVMGSEGREEQLLKSDQDNALVIADDADEAMFVEPMRRLNSALSSLGYKECKGDIMVTNPHYRKRLSEYKKEIENFMYDFSQQSVQNFTILLDAKFMAGDETLFSLLRSHIERNFVLRDDLLAHMAKAVLSFETPLSIFLGFVVEKDSQLDLKKGGIFAIVHGVRMLSLQKMIKATNTIERIKELNNIGVLDKELATELIESFDTLSSIRLGSMLEGRGSSVDPAKLDKIERDLLKDSFKVVNRFKKFLSYHFKLNMVV